MKTDQPASSINPPKTIHQLAEEQGVKPLVTGRELESDLFGDVDIDDWLDAIYSARNVTHAAHKGAPMTTDPNIKLAIHLLKQIAARDPRKPDSALCAVRKANAALRALGVAKEAR